MPSRRVGRWASTDQRDVPAGGPGWNSIRVDPSSDILVVGTGSSGTTEKTYVDLAATQTLTNKTLTSPVLNTPTINTPTFNTTSVVAFSTATVSAGYATDTYLAGSGVTIPTALPVAGSTYEAVFDMVKTAAGTAAPVITLRYGTAGTVADTAILTFTFAAGTAAVDTGIILVRAHFRTVGSGTAAVLVGFAEIRHALAATGLTSTGASGEGAIVAQVSSGFDSTPAASIIGLSFNGGASFSGTNSLVEASLRAI